jgi:hypothetical protein
MEAIGGTGDTLTGLLTILCGTDLKPVNAGVLAAKLNRWTGYHATPNPATQIIELIECIPQAVSSLRTTHAPGNIHGEPVRIPYPARKNSAPEKVKNH